MEAANHLSRPFRGTTALPSDPERTADFEAVFLEHYPRVFGILLRIVGEHGQADDLANEVFWKLYAHRGQVLVSGNVSGWLYRTATRAAFDAVRAANRRARHEQNAAAANLESGDGVQLNDLLRSEERAKVQAVLSSMKPARAEIVLLRADGASYNEIADILGVAVSSVGTLLNRAEADFRTRYQNLSRRTKSL